MKPNIKAKLYELMKEFIESDEFTGEAEIYIGDKTALVLTDVVEAAYDAMVYTAELEASEGEE